jgi:hypothetical protein
MTTLGVKITNLNTIANASLSGNIVIPVVDPTPSIATPDGESLKANINQVANFVLNNAGNLATNINLSNISNLTANVANIHILGGYPGYILSTNGSGQLSWVVDGSVSGDGGNAYTSILLQASLNGGNANVA